MIPSLYDVSGGTPLMTLTCDRCAVDQGNDQCIRCGAPLCGVCKKTQVWCVACEARINARIKVWLERTQDWVDDEEPWVVKEPTS